MKVLYYDEIKRYVIVNGNETARIKGGVFFKDCGDLLNDFYESYLSINWEFRTVLHPNWVPELLGEFESRHDIQEKFAEYLI